jgi:hypothetical protein
VYLESLALRAVEGTETELRSAITTEEIYLSSVYYDSMALYVCPGTTLAARLQLWKRNRSPSGCSSGEYHRSFAIVRPPGHHAERKTDLWDFVLQQCCFATKVVQQSNAVNLVTDRVYAALQELHHQQLMWTKFEMSPVSALQLEDSFRTHALTLVRYIVGIYSRRLSSLKSQIGVLG